MEIDDEPIPRSIEAMAADRLPLVQEAQPQGPYRLAGHCNGALLAFETARLLVADGHSVEWVAMIDPPGITARRSIQILLSIMNYILRLAGRSPEWLMHYWPGRGVGWRNTKNFHDATRMAVFNRRGVGPVSHVKLPKRFRLKLVGKKK